ncbi:hypothetical protein PPROV_000951800 [Pycnococcus provasolii]|uniref:Calcineurin-like phosphoesterase domain-containing protein n=1 Tax=Pycnococcus provasolii TaxID=41880 RepID=A0A830I0V9_9CHLO|nr:hypothetical protein PPROV_000951800 [Pycnococcus provasolii]
MKAADFRFALISDIQFADVPDKTNATGTQFRRYRGTLDVAHRAVEFFNAHHSVEPLAFALHNGDVIDHQAAWDFERDEFRDEQQGMEALKAVMRVLSSSFTKEWIFTLGNHEMYNFTRAQLRDGITVEGKRGTPFTFRCANERGEFYHSFSPHAKWRVVVLDPYDISVYSRGRGMGLCEDAVKLLCENSPSAAEYVKNTPDVFRTEKMSHFPYFKGLEGRNKRWVPFNGALSEAQLNWLSSELDDAAKCEQRVIIFSHLLVHPHTAADGGKTLLWNYEDALGVLRRSAERGNPVAAVFSGHQHEGGFHTCEEMGTHFVVMESPLLAQPVDPEHPEESDAGPYAVVEVSDECIRIVGNGAKTTSPLFRDAEHARSCVASSDARQVSKVRTIAVPSASLNANAHM